MIKKNRLWWEAVFWDALELVLLLRAPAANSTALGWIAKVKPAGKEEVGHIVP